MDQYRNTIMGNFDNEILKALSLLEELDEKKNHYHSSYYSRKRQMAANTTIGQARGFGLGGGLIQCLSFFAVSSAPCSEHSIRKEPWWALEGKRHGAGMQLGHSASFWRPLGKVRAVIEKLIYNQVPGHPTQLPPLGFHFLEGGLAWNRWHSLQSHRHR